MLIVGVMLGMVLGWMGILAERRRHQGTILEHDRYNHLYGVRSDETGRILERIAGRGARIWFSEPPELGETDELPAIPTPEQWLSAESSVKGIGFAPYIPGILSDLGRFPELKALSLKGNVLTDDSLSYLPVMKRLESFGIYSSPNFTGEGIKHLKNLPNLTDLTLCFIGGPRLTYCLS